jgi:hypothetical protein
MTTIFYILSIERENMKVIKDAEFPEIKPCIVVCVNSLWKMSSPVYLARVKHSPSPFYRMTQELQRKLWAMSRRLVWGRRQWFDNDQEDLNGVTMARVLINKYTSLTKYGLFRARVCVCVCVCVCVYTYTQIHGPASGKGQFKHNGESTEIAFCCVISSFIIGSSRSTKL